jgi:predicted pyridoxine 5'-phosphate oxidase superfamily flavin-nucleotide-binding protein
MTDSIMYHEGNRRMQDVFGSRPMADRLEDKLTRTAFNDADRELIENAIYFFIATADAEGRPDCSYKGGAPGFVRVVGPDELAFPDYDGNGMFKSIGNMLVNPNVGLLFIGLHEKPLRLRINGVASFSREDALMSSTVGAQLIVRVKARTIFPNCPRNVHKMQLIKLSKYVPLPGSEPLEPKWMDQFKDVRHPRQPTSKGDANEG